MIKLTNLADYAVVILAHVAQMGRDAPASQWFTAASVAAGTAIPAPTVTKIVGLLARADLLATQRGAHGGFQLARPPQQISIAAVVEAVDGPIALTQCVDHTTDAIPCVHQSSCAVSPHWQVINRTVRDALASLSVADLSKPVMLFDVPIAKEASHGRNR